MLSLRCVPGSSVMDGPLQLRRTLSSCQVINRWLTKAETGPTLNPSTGGEMPKTLKGSFNPFTFNSYWEGWIWFFSFPLTTTAVLTSLNMSCSWIQETFAPKRSKRKLVKKVCDFMFVCLQVFQQTNYVCECVSAFITELKVMVMRMQRNSALSWTLLYKTYNENLLQDKSYVFCKLVNDLNRC